LIWEGKKTVHQSNGDGVRVEWFYYIFVPETKFFVLYFWFNILVEKWETKIKDTLRLLDTSAKWTEITNKNGYKERNKLVMSGKSYANAQNTSILSMYIHL
jgi:hypothetical protein